MAGPWEQYAQPSDGPWSAYGATNASPKTYRDFSGNLQTMSPQTASALEGLTKKGFGSGLPHLAYSAGEGVTDAASKVPFMRGVPAATLGYLTNVGIQAVPSLIGGSLMKEGVSPVLDKSARSLMQSAIGPTKADVLSGKAGRAVNTFLEEGASPTEAGVEALKNKVGDLARQAEAILEPSNKVVSSIGSAQNAEAVANAVRRGTLGIEQAAPAENVVQALRNHPTVDKLGLLSVQDANAMKQANYAALGDAAYGVGLKPASEATALKAATAGLRKAVESAEPGVVPLNKKMADLMNAIHVSEARALLQANKNPVPLGTSVAMAAKNPLAALGLWANSSAFAKALAARTLYQGAKIAPAVGAIGGTGFGAAMGTAPPDDAKARAYAAALQRLGAQ